VSGFVHRQGHFFTLTVADERIVVPYSGHDRNTHAGDTGGT
jgi:hypothetical protein